MVHIAHRAAREAAAPDRAQPSSRPPLRILIADDHAAVRAGLREFLGDHPQLIVVGEAADGVEAVAQAHALHPDVLIMDISMPKLDGIAATSQLRAELPSVRVLGLSTQERMHDLHAIERAGAERFFTKSDGIRRLVDHLLAIHAGRDPGPETGPA